LLCVPLSLCAGSRPNVFGAAIASSYIFFYAVFVDGFAGDTKYPTYIELVVYLVCCVTFSIVGCRMNTRFNKSNKSELTRV
jgi:hypothetical protein